MDGSTHASAPSGAAEMELEMKPPPDAMEPEAGVGGPHSEGSVPIQRSRREDVGAPNVELCADQPVELRIEALLMASDRPLGETRLAEVLGIAGRGANRRILAAIEALNEAYSESGRAFRAARLAGGWQLLTQSAFGPLLQRLHEKRQEMKLSQPAMETLAIVAYRQPTMRAEIEAIRGVASGEVLRSLMERRLVKIVGRAEELGRPMLYGTTGEFLKVFGLANLEDLPPVKGLASSPVRPTSPLPEGSRAARQLVEQPAESADNGPIIPT